MAFRLKFSSRALREIGEAQEWYELQSPSLGEAFIAAMELQLKLANPFKRITLKRTPLTLHYKMLVKARNNCDETATYEMQRKAMQRGP